MSKLSDDQVAAFADTNPGWKAEGDQILKDFEFEDFNEALGFVMRVGLLAERANHHPDIDIRWNKVSVHLSTHSEGGITGKDTDLASEVDALIG